MCLKDSHTSPRFNPRLRYPEPSCSARGRAVPVLFVHATDLQAHLCGVWPKAGRLMVDIVGAVGSPHPGNRAPLSPYPLLFAQPLFPPQPTLLLFPLAMEVKGSLRDSMLFCAHCLDMLLVAGFLWRTKAPIHFLSFSFFDLLSGTNHCLITLGEKERDQWCF